MKNFDEFCEDMSSAITAVYQKHNIYSKIEDFFNEEDLYRVIRIMKNHGFFDTEDLYESKNISEDTFRRVFRENDQFEEKYNVYCYYQDAYDGGEEDGDPRNDKPLNYKDTVALMKKLMADFKADKLYGSYLYSSTSKLDDAWRIMAMSDDVVYVKNLIMKDGKPRITLTYDADMALNWETEQEAKDFMNKHMAEINARELEDVSVVQGDGYDVEPCYLDIKAYPNCDTDTLIMRSYDWTTREGFKMKAGEIYP